MKDLTIHEILNEEQCYEIIRKKLKQDSMDDYSLISYEIIPINEVNGYMGQYFKLKATTASPKSPLNEQQVFLFVKILPPTTNLLRDYSIEYGSFRKEITLYTSIFPKIFDGVNKISIPKCFLGIEDQVIVLEDMSYKGYLMTNKFVPFDLDHCKILMKNLALLHSQSLIFEERTKMNLSEEYAYCLEETLWSLKGDKGQRMLNAAIKGIISMIDLIPQLNKDERNQFKDKFSSFTSNHAMKLLPSKKYKNVICHSDLWANNVLYKYDNNNQPNDCCLIDFQLARYNPPAHDIMCFLQFTTTSQLRKQYSEKLFKIYYETMVESVKNVGLDITKIFPWAEFMESIDELRVIYMAHGIMNTPIMLLDSKAADKYFSENPELLEKILYVDRTPLLCEQFKNIPTYRARMLDGLIELYENLT